MLLQALYPPNALTEEGPYLDKPPVKNVTLGIGSIVSEEVLQVSDKIWSR